MRKSILRFGALALMSLMSIGAWAQQGSTDEAFYSVTSVNPVIIGNVTYDGEVTITAAKSNSAWGSGCDHLTISGKKYLITGIGNDAFKGYPTAVKIPKYVKTIGTYAYQNANVLPADESNTFDFSNVLLSEGSFFNANFYAHEGTGLQEQARTIIKMGEMAFGATSLPKKVFGVAQTEDFPSTITTKNDILAVTFEWSNTLLKVEESALEGRAGLTTFGWANSGAYYLPKELNEVGDHAFAGCSALFNFRYTSPHADTYIKKVGKYAFARCEWFNNAAFQNVCGSFAGLEFAEGSFYGCYLTNVDLSGWKIIKAMEVETDNSPQTPAEAFNGIPAYAFYGNPITELRYPANLAAIGDFAFSGNRLTSISLPEGLQYIGESALESADISEGTKFTQEKLLLPLSLKKIFAKGIGNRKFEGIYAHPSIVGNKTYPAYVPATPDNTEYTLYVPAKAPWTEGVLATNKTVKTKYVEAGWVNDVTEGSTQKVMYIKGITGYRGSRAVDNVKYSVSNGGQNDDYGYQIAVVNCFDINKNSIDKTAIVRGMVSFGMSDVSDGDVTYYYPLIAKVSMPETALTPNEYVTAITFNPQSVAVDINSNDAEQVAGEFANAYNDFAIRDDAFGSTWKKLASVTFNKGVTSIGDNAFKECSELADVSFADDATLTTVGNSAFEGTGITAIVLPRSLATIGTKSFNTEKLEKVTVSYDATSGTNLCPIPNITVTENEETFNAATKVLVVNAGEGKGTATREDYLAETTWSQFFETATEVSVKTTATDATLAAVASVDDVDDEGNVTRVFELSDKNDIAQIQITGAPTTGAPAVRYTRNFNNAHYQAWFVPFNYTYKGTEGCKFYYIYDTTQSGDYTADATTSIELKEVKVGKTIKANTPYIVKANEEGLITFESDAIVNTASDNNVTFGNVQNQFTFTGIYTKKEKTSGEGKDWYALLEGALYNFNNTEYDLNAYRFYMTYKAQSKIPYQFIKFNVLDDEDVTAIEALKAGNANAPMFDLQGRQIAAPAKGQVYIQNGVKKLAK